MTDEYDGLPDEDEFRTPYRLTHTTEEIVLGQKCFTHHYVWEGLGVAGCLTNSVMQLEYITDAEEVKRKRA